MTDREQKDERDRPQNPKPNSDPNQRPRERRLPGADEVLPPASQTPDPDEKRRPEERNRNQGTEGGRSSSRKPGRGRAG
jgi:hypothetical protein